MAREHLPLARRRQEGEGGGEGWARGWAQGSGWGKGLEFDGAGPRLGSLRPGHLLGVGNLAQPRRVGLAYPAERRGLEALRLEPREVLLERLEGRTRWNAR